MSCPIHINKDMYLYRKDFGPLNSFPGTTHTLYNLLKEYMSAIYLFQLFEVHAACFILPSLKLQASREKRKEDKDPGMGLFDVIQVRNRILMV